MALAQLVLLRGLFAVTQKISPAIAARAAFHLFLRTFRHPLRAADAAPLAQARSLRINIGADSIQLHDWTGTGPTAIIVHGWGSSAARFALMAQALNARGWRVLAFDAPGHGASSGRSSSLPQFMAALDTVIAHCGPPRALIGHSLGALAIACRHSDGPPRWADALESVVLISMPAGAEELLRRYFDAVGLSAATERRLLERFRARFHAAPRDYAALPGTARIAARVLLVHDRDDDIVAHADSVTLYAQLHGAEFFTTEGQGHSKLTREAATIARIVDFIDPPAHTMTVRRANLTDSADAAAVLQLIDAYARDPRGGGEPLPEDVRGRLVAGLAAHPTSRVWLAFEDNEAAGVCVGFIGYSTFNAQPLLNIHDLAVLPGLRGRGIGQALLAAAESSARAEGCCKLTLEVLEDNLPARRLYEHFGFRDVRYGNSGPTKFLGKPLREGP